MANHVKVVEVWTRIANACNKKCSPKNLVFGNARSMVTFLDSTVDRQRVCSREVAHSKATV